MHISSLILKLAGKKIPTIKLIIISIYFIVRKNLFNEILKQLFTISFYKPFN